MMPSSKLSTSCNSSSTPLAYPTTTTKPLSSLLPSTLTEHRSLLMLSVPPCPPSLKHISDFLCPPPKLLLMTAFLLSPLVINISVDGVPLFLIGQDVLFYPLLSSAQSLFTTCLPWKFLKPSSKLSIVGAVHSSGLVMMSVMDQNALWHGKMSKLARRTVVLV